MAVTLLVGPETTLQNVDDHVRDMDAPVHELEPDAAPLNTLLERLGTVPARNPKVEWMEDEAMPRFTTLSASAAASATTYSVADNIFRVGDLVRFPSQGFAVVVTATASGSITVAKVGPEPHASAASGSELFLVANAQAEGSTLREMKFPQIVTQYNYVQIVTDEFGVTGTEAATEHYSGPERARLQKKFGIEHSRKLDQVFWFGTRDISGTQRFCGGIKHFLATNVTVDADGTLAQSEWEAFLRTAFRYGSSRKVAFCSPRAISVIEGYARSNIRVVNDRAETFGIRMSQYVTGHGEVSLVRVPWWQDSNVYNGYCFVIDMDSVKKRPLRQTRLQLNVHAPDYDGFKDRYLTESSLQVIHERRHALLTNIVN